eukprot:TRINITY_DN11090_c0_g1_i2.p1 TRINITY_DN11090_c0_g1~~TRINITY_DN11090_c0_g1_i2.p1  ORF type:complete len:534 (-),score=117.95 TRINITY_DN11090_c0_g1_i2:208-1767(-)
MIAIAWAIFAGVVLGIVGFCWLIVRYYRDKHESEILPTWVTIFGMGLTLMCVFLIPVDIYSVSSARDDHGNLTIDADDLNTRSTSLRVIYYVLYSSILAFAFVIIPFAYFYYEEDDEHVSLRARVYAGCKYTVFLMLFVVILFIVGMIVWKVQSGSVSKPTSTEEAKQWIQDQVNDQQLGGAALSFAVASLTTIGYVSWITYTAYGMSALPIGMIKGRKKLADDMDDVVSNIEKQRDQKRQIQSKYIGGKTMSRRDEAKVDLLSRREKALNKQADRLEALETGWRKVLVVCRPFAFVFGIVFVLVSLLIFVSILLTNVDKAINSTNFCGAACGYVLAIPELVNPLDYILTVVSPYFPTDYVLLALIVIYVFFATLSGVTNIGVRFLWILMYKVRSGRTPAQGLLLTSIILMFSTLALNMEITTIAPQYATWGSQHYYDHTKNATVPCSIDAPAGNCTMTQIGTFVTSISVRTSFFAIIYYYATWVFLVAVIIGGIVAMCKARSSNVEANESDEDEDEDF